MESLMKWLILFVYRWWVLRVFNERLAIITQRDNDKHLSASTLLEIWEILPKPLLTGVPREFYVEHEVLTATATLATARKALMRLTDVVKRYNALTPEELLRRPNDTYIETGLKKLLGEIEITNLDHFMSIDKTPVTTAYIFGFMDLVRNYESEISKIEDEYDREYFNSFAAQLFEDVWSVINIIMKMGKHYG